MNSGVNTVHILVNGQSLIVPAGTVVAAAIARAGVSCFRHSVSEEPRAPLCGMGICMECCVTINHQSHCRSCLTLCAEGMEVVTDKFASGDNVVEKIALDN
jgi:hypothetical protein